MQVRVRIDGGITVLSPPAKLNERLRRELSVPNPEFIRLVRSGKTKIAANTPQRIDCTLETPEGLRVPRGAADVVRRLAAEENHELVFEDSRASGGELHVPKWERELRDYQSEGSELIRKHVQGIVVLPCAGGKTTLGLGAIWQVRKPTIVVVPTEDLLDQWTAELAAHMGISAGFVARGKMQLRPVTIAVINSLLPALDAFPELGRLWSFVILDEAHMAPASTFQRLLYMLPAKFRLGLTATPDREDGASKLVEWSFGPRLLERTAPDLIARGWLTAPMVEPVVTNFRHDGDATTNRRRKVLEDALIVDAARNAQICDLVYRDAAFGETQVVRLFEMLGLCGLVSSIED